MTIAERRNLLSCFGGTSPLDLASYRAVMAKPTRHYLLHAVVATRSYKEGLDIAVLLLRFTEANRAKLSQDEYQTYFIFLNYFLLEMLDRMDRWEEYLEVWNRLLRDTKVVSLSAVDSHSETHLAGAFDYLLRVTGYRKRSDGPQAGAKACRAKTRQLDASPTGPTASRSNHSPQRAAKLASAL